VLLFLPAEGALVLCVFGLGGGWSQNMSLQATLLCVLLQAWTLITLLWRQPILAALTHQADWNLPVGWFV
jgi:hypothetical protein